MRWWPYDPLLASTPNYSTAALVQLGERHKRLQPGQGCTLGNVATAGDGTASSCRARVRFRVRPRRRRGHHRTTNCTGDGPGGHARSTAVCAWTRSARPAGGGRARQIRRAAGARTARRFCAAAGRRLDGGTRRPPPASECARTRGSRWVQLYNRAPAVTPEWPQPLRIIMSELVPFTREGMQAYID